MLYEVITVQKVLEKELLTLDQIDAMSDKEKAELVMLPGLSTAESISYNFV